MDRFTHRELAELVMMYGEAHYNVQNTRRLWRRRYPNRRLPARGTILSVVQRFLDHGSVVPNFEGRGRNVSQRVLNATEQILNIVDDDPSISTRNVSLQVPVSHGTVHRVLRQNSLYPYHIQRVQQLTENDFRPRREFCEWFTQKEQRQANFLEVVLFTDECCFTRDGILNYHNSHIWSDENPHAIRETHSQWRFSVNVWAGIVGDFIIGPYVLPARLTGNSYLNFLRDTLPELLEEVPYGIRFQMWYMHDGAPAHASRIVVDFLNATYPRRWIGRNGPVRWPARSPDMNPLDFFFWGFMKNLVYTSAVNDENELRERIFQAANHIRGQGPDVLQRVRESFRRRINICVQQNGGHFQHLI